MLCKTRLGVVCQGFFWRGEGWGRGVGGLQIKGMTKSKKSCLICPYVLQGKDIKHENFKWNIKTSVNCATYNACYMLMCTKERCTGKDHIYIGETKRKLKDRIFEHLGYINTSNTTQPAGHHFNLPGHSKADMKVTILERQFKHDPEYRKERESFLIRKFNTFRRGLNEKPELVVSIPSNVCFLLINQQ